MSTPPREPPASQGVWALIRSDIRRKQEHYVLVDKFFNKVVKVLVQHGTLAVLVYRIGHWAATRESSVARALAWGLYACLVAPVRWVSKVTIDPRTPIGPGFVIHNFSGVHVQAERIGENFTINQGVFVGADWQRKGKPVLGDDVFLGAGAAVLGDVRTGDNVVVAANAVVAKSVGSNCLLAGVPALTVMRNLPPNYLGQVPIHRKDGT